MSISSFFESTGGRSCSVSSRIAQGGRNWEGFGADPFLSGESAYETILGMQAGGVQACAKHYINKCVLVIFAV